MSTTPTPPGRRERKKAAIREALSTAALRLFLERGYEDVGVREIADVADVSTTTLLNHFPCKEALVFDRDADLEEALIGAVVHRPTGTSPVSALREHMRGRVELVTTKSGASEFMGLVLGTPALADYWHKMWMRHEVSLARALAADVGAPEDDASCAALAHFALETSAFACRTHDPLRAVDAAFDILERGWVAFRPESAPGRTHDSSTTETGVEPHDL
jgi:AcrR family transcriptional regulator